VMAPSICDPLIKPVKASMECFEESRLEHARAAVSI